MNVTLSSGRTIPVEMHKVRIVQKTSLVPIKRRLAAIEEAGYNTFLLRTRGAEGSQVLLRQVAGAGLLEHAPGRGVPERVRDSVLRCPGGTESVHSRRGADTWGRAVLTERPRVMRRLGIEPRTY